MDSGKRRCTLLRDADGVRKTCQLHFLSPLKHTSPILFIFLWKSITLFFLCFSEVAVGHYSSFIVSLSVASQFEDFSKFLSVSEVLRHF
jgi:hypothetical protein